VENDSPKVDDEDQVYEPGVGDKVEGNGDGDGQWGQSLCVHACVRWEIRRFEDVFSLEYHRAL